MEKTVFFFCFYYKFMGGFVDVIIGRELENWVQKYHVGCGLERDKQQG